MKTEIYPKDYSPVMNIRETEIAIKSVKDYFERELSKQLNLTRVSAPLFVDPDSGLNDNLNGVERPVEFGVKDMNEGGGKKKKKPQPVKGWMGGKADPLAD